MSQCLATQWGEQSTKQDFLFCTSAQSGEVFVEGFSDGGECGGHGGDTKEIPRCSEDVISPCVSHGTHN